MTDPHVPLGVGALIMAGLAAAGEVAVQLLGVPLAVVMAAEAGAFLASHPTPLPRVKAFLRMQLWVFVGCVTAQILHALASWALGASIPAGALGFFALATCIGGPRVLPVFQDQLPVLAKAWMEKFTPTKTPPPPPPDGGTDAKP